ncbi:MAG: Holliday junction resolvase RuvX [Eubacteriales bacterium]|jgi:putative Holliday junction resolvase|nr:Holliday junction resolvase RuvX [Eubacteriales bacterium]
MKVLCVDYGESRTGIALSDDLGLMAHGLETIFDKSPKAVAQKIAQIAKLKDAETIVIGLPKNMNNTLGERGEKTLRFAQVLKEYCQCEIITWDERLSTVSAIGYLNETNTRGKKRKTVVDTLAAQIILQSYLDFKNKGG